MMDQCERCREQGADLCEICYLGNPCYGCEDYDRETKDCKSKGGCADVCYTSKMLATEEKGGI